MARLTIDDCLLDYDKYEEMRMCCEEWLEFPTQEIARICYGNGEATKIKLSDEDHKQMLLEQARCFQLNVSEDNTSTEILEIMIRDVVGKDCDNPNDFETSKWK